MAFRHDSPGNPGELNRIHSVMNTSSLYSIIINHRPLASTEADGTPIAKVALETPGDPRDSLESILKALETRGALRSDHTMLKEFGAIEPLANISTGKRRDQPDEIDGTVKIWVLA